MTHPSHPSHHPDRPLLLSIIEDKSVTLKGFATTDGPKTISISGITTACQYLMKTGALFRAAPHYHLVRYFSTEAAARSFERVNVNTNPKRKPGKTKPQAKIKAVFKPLAQRKHVELKVALTAKIVWPDHIKPICRMMPDRYVSTLRRQRIGEPGWSMSI